MKWCYQDLHYYKYRLNADLETDLTRYGVTANQVEQHLLQKPIITSHYTLFPDGKLRIIRGYSWDGPSGPTIDTDTFMRGSLVHDCLYQMMRSRQLKPDFRDNADLILRRICEEDGMMGIRAWWVHKGVSWFGAKNARPHSGDDKPDTTCLKIPLHAQERVGESDGIPTESNSALGA